MQSGGTSVGFGTLERLTPVVARGADVSQRDSSRNNCLYLLMTYCQSAFGRSVERQEKLRDLPTLMITSGADICALND